MTLQSNSKKNEREINIKSTTENLSIIREFIKKEALNSGLTQEAIGNMVLAVDEACTNVIKHAYKYSPDGEIAVKVKVKKSKFTIEITDKGAHFNPSAIPEPDLAEYHKQKKIGGLGMFLMRKLMDEVEYTSISGNRNQVTLVKYLT